MKTITKEDCFKILNDNKYKYISGEYLNSLSKITICDNLGYMYETTLNAFNYKIKNKTGFSIVHTKNPYSILNIKLWLSINNKKYLLISNEYKGRTNELVLKCDKGHEFSMSWSNLQKSVCCPKCYRKYTSKEEFIEFSKEYYGDEYTIIGDYVNSETKILIRHNKCGNEFYIKPNHFSHGHGCNNRFCCHVRGKNHYKWNENLTDEQRKENNNRLSEYEYREWRTKVFEKYNYKCIICNDTKKLEAHHLYSWDKNIDKRYDIDNGVCLCQNHHKNFHKIYKFGNNTKEQFNEFLKQNFV